MRLVGFVSHAIFVYEQKQYVKILKARPFSRMALQFDTRDFLWTPSLYQKQIAATLIKSTTLKLYRQALLQPPNLPPLPDKKLRVTYICAQPTDSLKSTF